MRAVSPRVDVAFVHIPKTGGTAIEMAAWRQARLPWGIYYAGRWEFLLRESCSVRNATCAGCLQGGVNESCMDAMATEHGVTTSCPKLSTGGGEGGGEARWRRDLGGGSQRTQAAVQRAHGHGHGRYPASMG